MPDAHVLQSTHAATADSYGGNDRTRRNAPLSANAQAWRRLAREGYGRTAERVRATQNGAQHGSDGNPSR